MLGPTALLLTAAAVRLVLSAPLPNQIPGKYVPFSELHTCPPLSKHIPANSRDVRLDNIGVVMALGDSITAGFLATNAKHEGDWDWVGEQPHQQSFLGGLEELEEYRGRSYAIGGDKGRLTIPNILKHYSKPSGQSTGRHPILACPHAWCQHEPGDRLNAAVSGSTSFSLPQQANEYLVPAYRNMTGREKQGWALLNVHVGANDICAFCMTSNSHVGPGTPEDYVNGIREAVEAVRAAVPKLIVNIVGVLKVSAVYDLTKDDPYCQHVPHAPHLPIECSCALLPGAFGDWTRRRMDALSVEYDRAVLSLIAEWNAKRDPTFAAVWQSGDAIDLPNYPITALSDVDCFHPSADAHARLAAGLWNRYHLDLDKKAAPIHWEGEPLVRCIGDKDRIKIPDM